MKFRMILRKYIINNIGYKILAIVFSFLLWLVILNVMDPEQSKTFPNVPVQILNEDLVLNGEQVYTISSGAVTSVIFTGNRSIVTSLTINDFTVTADFEELSITNAVPIKVALKGDKVRYSSQISMTTRDTSMIISLENMASKQIPVEVEFRGEMSDTIVIDEANLSPKKVTIDAAQSIVDSAEKAVVSVNYAEVPGDTVLYLTPSIRDANGNVVKDSQDISLDTSQITVEFKTSVKKNVPISVHTSGSPAEGYTVSSLELSQDDITVKGPGEAIAALETIELPPELVDVSDASEDLTIELDITPYLPENVVVYGESPTFNVTVRISASE